jgi:hypothetical protein
MAPVNEDDIRRVEEARERAMAQANEFFESLSPQQVEEMCARVEKLGDGPGPPIDREAMGTTYEANGWMPKAEYLEMERIIATFQAGRPISDSEFDTMLRFLREARESIIRARVLAFLGELAKRDRPGLDRIARIEEAITPFREGPEDLDILSWSFVREALDTRTP